MVNFFDPGMLLIEAYIMEKLCRLLFNEHRDDVKKGEPEHLDFSNSRSNF